MYHLFIPPLGTIFVLEEDWNFTLHRESRNSGLLEYFFPGNKWDMPSKSKVTLPKDTRLTLDRIYIRKGVGDYDSVTFRAAIPDYKKSARFWVKLSDANTIRYKVAIAPNA